MENLFLKKEQSVTFTGHRFIPYGKLPILKAALKNGIIELYAKGCNNYYCAWRWDSTCFQPRLFYH